MDWGKKVKMFKYEQKITISKSSHTAAAGCCRWSSLLEIDAELCLMGEHAAVSCCPK